MGSRRVALALYLLDDRLRLERLRLHLDLLLWEDRIKPLEDCEERILSRNVGLNSLLLIRDHDLLFSQG